MRLTSYVLKARTPQSDKVPLQEILQLKLKNKVSGKYDQKNEGSCVHEVLNLIGCLSDNQYENHKCSAEAEKLDLCYTRYRASKADLKYAKQKGLLMPGQKKFTHMQIRTLLKKYPI
ncbi:PREDICTED: uncharacterized protein LOC105362688 [Ceratosolen solmsi marchali]|uniref:Uncharacterized protein LOC105362688 n=1 Tax=Ceratosolen solmsi marchali TaxID=326594 RepID=A0AAJ6YI60_9HYME|nr:PREDICTED: uncharacterized protein LOC105362688 [Ceratosolen solmsi marchali]